ncbi:hypothetical protein CORC01_09429 [Colletotrichum orchidophilum]|uniref:Uncharacterized protein n=1 Tax=Colletotrichum orchidophilum TaxID=1209926 RepID=A0A1G4B1L3_9PEZI|nr:uncharacterized protein CORC01_09429 [Colletotrichum orchidophilum]OHE95284.1 hypothetical protein CORC01_09429 [Colletotrichum orchidophilum]
MDPFDPLELREAGPQKPRGPLEPSVLDRKRPVARFPDSFSANLGRKASSFFRQDEAPGIDQNTSSSPPPLPESKSIIHRKRDVVPGLPSPSTSRDRQASAASSVKAMVAKFEGATATPDNSDKMADHGDHDLTPSTPAADKGKGKASFDESTDTTAASIPTGAASQPMKDQSAEEITDLELLKMEEFFKTESLARCLDNYVAPKYIHKKVKVLPLEEDEGVSMVKAAKIELWNKLASLNEAYEERHPSAKEERLAKEAAVAAANARLDEVLGESSKQGALNEAAKTSTRAERRAEQKAQKKADKKAQKASKREMPAANAPQAVTSPTVEEHANKEASLREKYPETYAKIDYWRSLGAPDKPADSGSEYTVHSDDELPHAAAQPVAQETQTITAQGQAAASKVQKKQAPADDSSSEDDNWSTGSSNGDPFYLNKYLTPEYQAKAQAYLKSFDKDQTQAADKPVYGPVPPPSFIQSGGKTIVGKPTATHRRPQQATESDESYTFIQRDPKEAAKVSAAQKERNEINRRAYERVNAAHARGEIVHLENTKPIRDTFATDIKKEDIVPGFGKGKKKQAAAAFDEEAYAARSIASHTMKPAPLRIPSRAKQTAVDNDKVGVKDAAQVQNKTPTVPDAHPSNTGKYRMVAGESTSLDFDLNKLGSIRGSTRAASGLSTQSGGPKSSGSARNFSWPKKQQTRGKNKYEFVDDDDDNSNDEAAGKKKQPGKTQTHPTVSGSGGGGGGSSSRQSDPLSTLLNNHSGFGNFTRKLAPLPKPQTKDGNDETGGRRSFTADEYQTLIQDEFTRFTQQSPEKKARDLEVAIAILNGAPSLPSSSGRTSTASAPAPSNNVTRQTVTVGPFHQRPAVRLAGTTALPPTPATSAVPASTAEKMAELDDFFAEENDHHYTIPGPAATGSSYGSSYSSTASVGQQTKQQENQEKDQQWNDPNYHEDALSFGYAYQQTGYTTLPDELSPVPLTHNQRRQVLEQYGISEAEYPAPPAGYPNPPGPEPGSVAPPCPSRPAPMVPPSITPATSTGGGSRVTSRHSRSSGAPAPALAPAPATVQSLRTPRRFRRAATAPSAPAPESPAPGYDDDWFGANEKRRKNERYEERMNDSNDYKRNSPKRLCSLFY